MVHLGELVLFTLVLPGSARRNIHVGGSHHDAQDQTHTRAETIMVSADAREALLPGSLTGLLSRRGPPAGALHPAGGHAASGREKSHLVQEAWRSTEPQMGASVRELRDRVGSVKNTKKITSAMKLVAAAKVRRAQEATLRSRPFSETLDSILGGLLQRVKTESLDIPLLADRPVKKVGLVTITGDRGLCGAYNSAAIKKTEQRIAELKSQGVEVELITIGNKATSYFKRRDTPVRKAIPCGQSPTAAQAKAIADELLSSFYAGELDRIELLYTSFISMISSEPSVRTLVPLLPSDMEMEGDEIFKLTSKDGDIAVERETLPAAKPASFVPDMIFEQDPAQLLNSILPLYLNGQLLRALQESVASELASRMSAMQSATDNAKDLQGRLEQEMNRARQSKITQELMEIIAGADATG